MTTYKLTTNKDTFSGGSGADTFSGPGGSNDVLRGNGGNDTFAFQKGQYGLDDGRTGQDRLHMVGDTNNAFETNLKIVGIESLTVDSTGLYATVDQLDSFTKFDVNNNSKEFTFFLSGKGGTLDFSKSFTEPQKLTVDAIDATSAVKITGSAHSDELQGSDFSDTLNGYNGNDLIYGAIGNDKISGGLGNDHLFGEDGHDTFVFDTKLGPSNIDHIGDFRYTDDTIKLDHHIFTWTGQHGSALKASEFKVIGNGQQEDANDHIIYNQKTGDLYYDVDGKGGHAMVKFAVLDDYSGSNPLLTYHDILMG